jgi:hypothetical protein
LDITVATSAPPARRPSIAQRRRDQRHDLVAVDDAAGLVDDVHPVGVAVERDAEIGAGLEHLAPAGLGIGRAAAALMLAVRRHAERHDIGAELPQHRGRGAVGGAVGAVDHDAQPSSDRPLGKVALANST